MKIIHLVRKHFITILLLVVLCAYWWVIFSVNFSGNPAYYFTDMYSDMNYAEAVWEQKTVFPDGWVFGNQLYAVATPVLAAVFWGITGNHCVAMGIAASLMGIGVLLSFGWMLKPVFPKINDRLVGMILFMTVVLWFGDSYLHTNGWQLFFTVCSYYACYAITYFLAFGCYLRSNSYRKRTFLLLLGLCCFLSFGTGLQSLRQTAVMVCPLLAMEAGRAILCLVGKKKWTVQPIITAGVISAANLSGLLCAKLFPVKQMEIFGQIELIGAEGLPVSAEQSLLNLCSLFSLEKPLKDWLLVGVFLVAVAFCVFTFLRTKNKKGLLCLCLLTVSVAGIFLIDTVLTMYIRNIYYFMIYPLLAFLGICLYSRRAKILQFAMTALVVSLAISCFYKQCVPVLETDHAKATEKYEQVSDFLLEKGYTTVYSGWNRGEKVAIASDWELKAGFWDSPYIPFVSVRYLCDPAVFDAAPEECAYIFFGSAEAAIGVRAAAQRNVSLQLLESFPESGIYVFTASVNLMQ